MTTVKKQQESSSNSSGMLNTNRNYSTTTKEKNERYVVSSERGGDTNRGDYTYSSRFRPIDKDANGAGAILVQDIPDGVLGRPVEFESEYSKDIVYFYLTQ